MSYLMIENPGEAPAAGLLLFGATTKDPNEGSRKTIGMFGSGTKHGILVCLRKKVDVQVFTGTEKLTFSTRRQMVGETEHEEVLVSVNGGKAQSTGAVLAFGQHDWKDHIALALREFVSNALDAVDGDTEKIRMEVVDTPRARAGSTRVFVAWPNTAVGRESVKKFQEEWFLHFRIGYDPDQEGPIRKVTSDTTASFYRRGVLIRKASRGVPSLWDYNFVDMKLDEARNSDEYTMEGMAARMMAANPRKLARTLKALSQQPRWWEANLSGYAMGGVVAYGSAEHKAEVEAALELEFSPEEVLIASGSEQQIVKNLGKTPVMVPANWATMLDQFGSQKSFTKSLTEDQRLERTILQTLPEVILHAYFKWEHAIEEAGLAMRNADTGVVLPKVYAFREAPHKLEKLWGFCRQGDGVYVNVDAGGTLLDHTMLEELAHWHSGFRDFDRDFQNWVFRFAVEVFNKK